MNWCYLLSILFCLYRITWSQKNCADDSYDSNNDCYECDYDIECISCPNSFEEVDCSACDCVYTPAAYVVTAIFWICICLCCGACCKFICKNQTNNTNHAAPLLSNKSANINKAGTAATFIKCPKCGKYNTVTQRKGTEQCTVCQTSLVNNTKSNDCEEEEGQSATLKCTQCNETYPMESKFCSKCGLSLKLVDNNVQSVNEIDIEHNDFELEVKPSFIKCQNCGKNNSSTFSSSNICWKCGQSIIIT